MFSSNKTFSTFDRPQKPFCFVSVNSVLNVFAVGKQFKIVQPVIGAVKVLMVNFHARWDRAYKRLPHSTVDGNLGVFPVFARAKPDVMVCGNVRFDRPSVAIASPRLAVLDVERGSNAGAKEIGHSAQCGAIGKHSFGIDDLFGAKQLSARHASHTRKIANFVKAFVAANWFPYLHAVEVKPIYVGGQP